VNARREIVGLDTEKMQGGEVSIRARRAVIFGTGGYTQNAELMRNYQPGPVYGGCAAPTNEGDFVYMATAAGAKLGNMAGAWRAQVVLEQALQFSSTPDDVFMPPGDSMILVNRYGERVVNEKSNYNERTRIHFFWDSTRHEWTNRLLFMVYDQRTAELYGGRFPLPAAGAFAPYVLKADTMEGLTAALGERLAKIAPKTGGVRLDDGFTKTLEATVARFNGYARRGTDEQFARGKYKYDRLWHSRVWSFPNQDTDHQFGAMPNPTMHAFTPKGPYHAIVLAGGTLDTNGGPLINASAQILDYNDRPIPGLYGAGNCVSSPTADYYYGGGGTLGPAVAFAYIAAQKAAAESIKDLV